MITGRTSSGFEFHLNENTMDDYELLEALCEIDNGDYSKTTLMVEKLLGKEQKNDLKEHVRNKEGKVLSSLILAEVMEIFKACKEGKNS